MCLERLYVVNHFHLLLEFCAAGSEYLREEIFGQVAAVHTHEGPGGVLHRFEFPLYHFARTGPDIGCSDVKRPVAEIVGFSPVEVLESLIKELLDTHAASFMPVQTHDLISGSHLKPMDLRKSLWVKDLAAI